ncbi:MAG: septum formation protein Maf [Clostridia bacterium]|nr:septum formation protein Maf [Clostridia bacterium]
MFVLASASPRRSMLLRSAGYEFEIMPSDAEEKKDESLSPCELAVSLAESKCENVYLRSGGKICLGADTIVVFEGKILGKPADKSINAQYLKKLSGNVHSVITGYCIIKDGKKYSGYDQSFVKFNELSDELISSYVESGNGLDKAGGYGIQDGFDLVEKISGSYSCVVGLPMEKITPLLEELL